MMTLRIGQGFDVHAFASASERAHQPQLVDGSVVSAGHSCIVLGGVTIASNDLLVAHSDGDVLLHALTDALLGALALGDIGKHFPDTDPQWKNADSRALLRHVMQLIKAKGYMLVNADLTIVAQAPKMAPHIVAMRSNIASDTSVEIDAISVKATTTEFLGFTGREEGIACFATVLLSSSASEL